MIPSTPFTFPTKSKAKASQEARNFHQKIDTQSTDSHTGIMESTGNHHGRFDSIDSNKSSLASPGTAQNPELYLGERLPTEKEDSFNQETADSFIGGSSVISRTQTYHTTDDEEEDEKDEEQGDESFGRRYRRNIKNVSDNAEINTSDIESKKYKNSHKIFTFTLPFGGNPLGYLPSFRQLKHGIPIIGSSSSDEDDLLTRHMNKGEIKTRLKRQESISTIEEAYLFRNLKGQGSSRLRAVKNALTPNINIHTFNDEKKEKVESVWDQIDGDIVIMGGYRGSVLRDAHTGRRVWIPLRAGFNMRKIDLLIGPTDEDEAIAQENIYSDDMLTHVGPIDISKKLKSKLSNGKAKVHMFGYDWRLSSEINSRKLQEFLSSLPSNKGPKKKGVLVIAHSMGGLIAHHVMQQDPSLFRGLIYVGVPSECPNILGPTRFGDAVLFSNKILTPEANFFMRSSFVFLPLTGRCFVNRRTHKKYDLDYFDPEVWTEYNLSPLVCSQRAKGLGSIPIGKNGAVLNFDEFSTSYEDSKRYLTRTLKRTKKFLDELEYDPTKKYPPLVIVYGNEVPTVRGVRVESPQGIKDGEYDDFFYGPGDGVVNHKWLMPERRGFPVTAKIASDRGHISLMTDFGAMGSALEEILMAEKASLMNQK